MREKSICILTVVDSISTTSMPVNEFVLYRQRKGYQYRQAMIVCSKEKDDVLIPDSIATFYVGNEVKAFRNCLKDIKQECVDNDESLVCHLHGQKSALLFFWAARGLHLREHTLYTVHSTYSSRDLKYRLSSCACSLLARYANCVSYSAYTEYASWVKKIKGERMLAIQNGVDYDRIQEAVVGLPRHQDVADVHKLACVGRMIPIKNQQFLVKLMKHLPDTQLLLIGKENDDIKELAKTEGVADRVEMTGLLPRDDVFRKLNECGIYVSASLVEGMPVSVLEAMGMGLIPVLSDIAPHEEVAKGCMFIHTTPLVESEWVKTITEYQKLAARERNNLSDYLRNSIKQNFSLDTMHRSYNEIYKELTEKINASINRQNAEGIRRE